MLKEIPISGFKNTSIIWWAIKNLGLLTLLFSAFYYASQGGLNDNPILLMIARILMSIGALISIIHYLVLKRANTDISRPMELVSKFGLFRWVRHPMYLGDLLLCWGLFVMAPSAVAIFLAFMISSAVWRLCMAEDYAMQNQFRSDFNGWCKKTKRLIPFLI